MQLTPPLAQIVAAARARVCVGYPWWLRPFLAPDVIAITLGRRIFLREGNPPERLLRHELAHVQQVNRLGLLRFLWCYGTEFAKHWMRLRSVPRAYAAISFEIEACAAEEGEIAPIIL